MEFHAAIVKISMQACKVCFSSNRARRLLREIQPPCVVAGSRRRCREWNSTGGSCQTSTCVATFALQPVVHFLAAQALSMGLGMVQVIIAGAFGITAI